MVLVLAIYRLRLRELLAHLKSRVRLSSIRLLVLLVALLDVPLLEELPIKVRLERVKRQAA